MSNDFDKAIIENFRKGNPEKDCALTVCHSAYVEFGATAHNVQDNSILCHDEVPVNTAIRNPATDTVRARSQGKTEMQLSAVPKTIELNRILHVTKVAHNLMSVSELFDDGHAGLLTKTKRVAKKVNTVVGVGNSTGPMITEKHQ